MPWLVSKSQMLVFTAGVALVSGSAAGAELHPATAAGRTGTLLVNPAPIERSVDALVRKRTRATLNSGLDATAPVRPLFPVDLRNAWGTTDLRPEDQPLASVEVDAPRGVSESTVAPDDVPLGLAGLVWAARRPGEVWRLFTPISR
jgi:hypothetical protein